MYCTCDLLVIRSELKRLSNKLGVKVRRVPIRVNPWFKGWGDLSLLHLKPKQSVVIPTHNDYTIIGIRH